MQAKLPLKRQRGAPALRGGEASGVWGATPWKRSATGRNVPVQLLLDLDVPASFSPASIRAASACGLPPLGGAKRR